MSPVRPHNRFGAADTFSLCGACATAYANPVQHGYPYDEGYAARPDGITHRQAYIAYSRLAQIEVRARSTLNVDHHGIDLLDIGCGFGDMVSFARHLDFHSAWGIDVNPALPRFSIGGRQQSPVLIGHDPFATWDSSLPGCRPNVVCLYDVLEHVPAPAGVLQEIGRRAAERLLLVVSVPQIPQTDPRVIPIAPAELLALFRREPHPTEHFYLFSDAAIERLARQCALRVYHLDRDHGTCMRGDGDYTTYYLVRDYPPDSHPASTACCPETIGSPLLQG